MRTLTLCLLSALLLTACEDESAEPETTVPAAPEEIVGGTEALLGRWAVTEQNGEAPADLYYVTFTRDGDYLVQDELGATQRSTFHPAGENRIAVTDSAGTRHVTYDVDGPTLTLSDPDTGNTTRLTRADDGL